MKFWTALQYPLCQAALVCDGQIVRTIPRKPPNTPARRVSMVSQYDDYLVVGRRCNIELWDREGTELLHSVYHPWIYSLHDCLQVGSQFLIACAVLDVVFLLDLQGRESWNWWAYQDELAAEPAFVHRDNWQTVQLTQDVEHEMAHLNSISLKGERTVLATLLKRRVVVELDLDDPAPRSQLVRSLDATDPHDFQYHHDRPVYGSADGITVNGQQHKGYLYVKRIIPLAEDRYLFTHEQGVTQIDRHGNRLADWTLPRPFGITCLEHELGDSIHDNAVDGQTSEDSAR